MVLAVIMMITLVPLGVFAQEPASEEPTQDATSSATYYTKPNWEARIRDESRWKVEDNQTLVRVSTSDPVQMNDIDYDGMYINASGRYVVRLIYKEKTQALSSVWHRALINFGELEEYIDFANSYVVGSDGTSRYEFETVKGFKGRGFDVRAAVGDRTNNRKNLPINLVLKDGVDLKNLPKKNYIVQMRLTNHDYTRVYSYAPGKSSMDYSSYTKTTSVSLEDNLNNLFIKGGYQEDSNNATNQEFFMSEFIANPEQYPDKLNLGIIRTQYMGQTNTIVREDVGGEPIAFTQVFDDNLVSYMKEDDKGNIGYINLLTVAREESPYAHKIGIKRNDFNKIQVENGSELAYLVFATEGYKDIVEKKDPKVKVVKIDQNNEHTMLSGFYITGVDYLVDKKKFEDTFAGKDTLSGGKRSRKLNYSTMSGWTNPNKDGWLVYKKSFDNDYVVQEGDSFMVDAGANAKGKQIMIQVGGEQAMLRRPQGYYNGYVTGKGAIDQFNEVADGIFEFTIREGATILKEKKLKIYMPYTASFNGDGKINFLQIHNGTKLNEGAANLKLLEDRKINMHLYKQGKKGKFILKYTLKNGTPGSLEFTPKLTWSYNDKDGVMTGIANGATLPSGGNFYINTAVLKEGEDIIVESYDNNGTKIESETSWFKYIPLDKSTETVKLLTWTDHSDKRSVLSINKSLYTPYQVLFTNDYAEGNAYKNPRALPSDNNSFNTETTKIVGYTKYDSGKVRTLYEEGKTGKLYGKVEAAANEYKDNGDLKGSDVRKDITIAKKDIFDAQFAEDKKTYKAFEYEFDLTKMLPYHSDDTREQKLTLLKDMKFVATASDGSSLPSDLFEARVRARVLFDANGGELTDGSAQVAKAVKIVPDNLKFYGEDGYVANGFEGEGADTSTGDKFPDAPTLDGKTFLGWVTEEGKTALNNQATVTTAAFNALSKDQVFTNTTAVKKHLVVYAIYTEDKVVTFDANGGKFADGKDEMTKQSSDLANVEVPKREGYTFKGWASEKNATTADPNALKNVTDSKTVYAVWEQEADKKLTLKAPAEPVPVSDKTDLTNTEKEAVKEAVLKANPDAGLSKDDITVGSDGKVTVKTADGKTGELTPEQTVKQKEVINNIKPPEKPVEVKNPSALDETEKNAVKDAIIKANPELNLTRDNITVDADGKATINQGGKTGTVPADKTVVKADNVLKLNKPTPVEVRDVNNLSPTEKEAVAAAVKAKNSLPDTAQITVDANGNVTVTDGNKKGELAGSDTVKLFDRTGKDIKAPAKTKVANLNELTEAEKEAVREAVKAANPHLYLKDEEIHVSSSGEVSFPVGNGEATIPEAQTVEKASDADNILALKSPKVTPVKDTRHLSNDDKAAIIQAVKDANPTLGLQDSEIKVAEDGSVTVTKGGKTATLSPADTIVKKLDAPEVTADEDGSVTVLPKDARTSEVEVTYKDPQGNDKTITAKKKNGEWKLVPAVDGVKVDENTGAITIPANKIKNDTEVKAVAKDGDNTSDVSTATSKDNKAPEAPELSEDADGNVTIKLPKDKDATEATVKYTDASGVEQTVILTKSGNAWMLPQNAPQGITVENGKVKIPDANTKNGTRVSAQAKDAKGNETSERGITVKTTAERIEPELPDKIKVANPSDLTDDNKTAIKNAVTTANNSKFPQGTTVEFDSNGNIAITYPDGSIDTIPVASLVEKEDSVAPAAPTVKVENDGVKITPPSDADTKTVTVTYKDPQGNEKTVTATKENGTWKLADGTDTSITIDGNGVITLPKDKVKPGTEVSAEAEDASGNKSAATDTSKATVPAAEKPQAPTVKAEDDGSVKVTPATDTKTTKVEVTYTPEGQTNEKTITFEKDASGNWKKQDGSDIDSEITIDSNGVITIPADKVKDNTEVKAVAKDASGTESEETNTSKATAQTPAAEKPQAPTVKAEDNGDVKITPATDNKTTKVEVKYTPEGSDTAVTVTATKDATTGKWSLPANVPQGITINEDSGVITIPKAKIKPGTEVKAKAKDANDKESTEAKVKVTTLADKYTPAYTEADGQAGTQATVSAPSFTDTQGQVATVPAGTTFTLGQNPPQGATIDTNGNVKYTPTESDKGTTVRIPVIVKYSDGSTDNIEAKITVAGQNINKPNAPTVTANNDGSVTVIPSSDANTKTLEVTYTPTGQANTVTVTATKDANGTWSLPSGVMDVMINPSTGVVTIPADKVADGTTVKAVAKDSTGTHSSDEASANAQTPTAPAAPIITAENDGSVKVTLPNDAKAKTVEVKYTDNNGQEKTVTLEKGNQGNWQLPADAPDGLTLDNGVVTIPADKIKGNTVVKAVAKGDGNTQSDPAEAKSKLEADEDLDFDLFDISGITPVSVGNIYMLTEDEKESVRQEIVDAIKKAKPSIDNNQLPTIEVADNGDVTIKLGGRAVKTFPQNVTVTQNNTTGLAVKPANPPVQVNNKNTLTAEEKKAVEDAIRKANAPDLDRAVITVDNNGAVTITDNGKSTTLPGNKVVTERMPLPQLYYPDTTVGVGDERTIYPIGTPGHVSEALEGIDAPRGVYVRVNPDGSISIEVSPRYSGPSIFTIRGYVYVDGILTPISINVRVKGESRRRRLRREREDEDIVEDTREVYTHKAYIFGYPDGTVRPNGNVTRAEAAAMLARLLEDENTASALKPAFTDTPSHWYNKAINAALSRGVMKGYPDGTFKPNAPITRAEFTQMISQIDAKPYGEAPFADVKDHWAKLAIGKEYAAGRISGYPDGTFRPNAPITRAEAAHILNKIFDRNYDSVSAIQSEDKMNINVFGDLFTSFWGYNDMVEATNTHTFRRRSKNSVSEDWSEINRISR